MEKYGLDAGGQTQRAYIQNVLSRIRKHMPFQTGVMSNTLTQIDSPTTIKTAGPYARYLFYGKVMVNEKTGKGPPVIPGVGPRWKEGTVLKETDRDLDFSQEKHGIATRGARWDLALIAAEGDVIAKEVESYIKYIGGRND